MSHRHVCRCGNYLVCRQELDRCPIRSFNCPICEDRAMDDYFAAQLETSLTHTDTENMTDEHQQRVS